ncbi:hypothetical protein PO124_10635 [Bacillus licheniformis]|nr:hypothetical protein [Bacillus licheniformis]
MGRIALEHKGCTGYGRKKVSGLPKSPAGCGLKWKAAETTPLSAIGCICAHAAAKEGNHHGGRSPIQQISRKAAGEPAEEQITAANVNTIFLVNALGLDLM